MKTKKKNMNRIGNNRNKHNVLIILYVITALLFLSKSYHNPYIGLYIEKDSDQNKWSISQANNFSIYNEWFKESNIEFEDKVIKVDDHLLTASSENMKGNQLVKAETITFEKSNSEVYEVSVNPLAIKYWAVFMLILPSIYAIISLIVVLYLLKYKTTIPVIDYCSYFLLIISLAYISSPASSMNEVLGKYSISSLMLLSVVIMIKMILSYIQGFKQFEFPKKIKLLLYIFPLLPLVVMSIEPLKKYEPTFTLVLFSVLFVWALTIVSIGIFRFKIKKLYSIILGILLPISPFISMYVIPIIFRQSPILPPEVCTIFLLFIPYNIIFLQIPEFFTNFAFYIKRINYYCGISFIATTWLILILYIFKVDITLIAKIAIIMYISNILFLYYKEYFDYKYRGILFANKNPQVRELYTSVGKMNAIYSTKELLKEVQKTLCKFLNSKDVTIKTEDLESELCNGEFEVGEIYESDTEYFSILYSKNNKRIVVKVSKDKLKIQHEQKIWLELFCKYINNYLMSTIVLEELALELSSLSPSNQHQPSWLNRLNLNRIDKVKMDVAQELHDSILQQLIEISRRIHENNKDEVNEMLLESIASIRTYCESLKPPLLLKKSLHFALENLVYKISSRNVFRIYHDFERLYLDDAEMPLSIYYIIQELLLNAEKHSRAKNIYITLKQHKNGCKIKYKDDGIGFNIEEVEYKQSLGIIGIKERVAAYNGEIHISSSPKESVKVVIIFEGLEAANENKTIDS